MKQIKSGHHHDGSAPLIVIPNILTNTYTKEVMNPMSKDIERQLNDIVKVVGNVNHVPNKRGRQQYGRMPGEHIVQQGIDCLTCHKPFCDVNACYGKFTKPNYHGDD